MWIFTSKSFLFVVVDRSHPSRLLVRASVCHQTNLGGELILAGGDTD